MTNKFSSTVEELGLDRKAYHLLKRASIRHVSSIITRGESGILNIRGMGGITANHIFSAVAKHLSIPENDVFSAKTMQDALSYEEKPFDPLNAPITILDLPFATCESLNLLGAFVVGDLIQLKVEANGGYRIGELRRTEIRKIYTELNSYLSRHHNHLKIEKSTIKVAITPTLIDLSTILALIVKDERALLIIELRAKKLLTLEEIAAQAGGVTRERIRQIIDQIHERIRGNLNLLKIFCDIFEERTKSIDKCFNNIDFTITALAKQCKVQLPDQDFRATESEIETLIAIVRLLAIRGKTWAQEFVYVRWKKFVFMSCVAKPSVTGHEAVKQTLIDNILKNRKLSYKELSLSILSTQKRPMHWSEIVERAYHIGLRESINSSALYNALTNYPELFVRVDPGTYALVEWGVEQVDTYVDIIASILKSLNKPISADAIYHKVSEIREIKQSTLLMSLEMHPRFYKSLEETYGLRVWLLPREKQTLRTPERLVEDRDSYKRLERASQRGYDVENMLQIDLDSA